MSRSSDRFLTAFSRLEEALRRLADGSKRDRFGDLVAQAVRSHAQVRACKDDLLEYADLRNAIVHERGGGFVIAEPHETTTEKLERLVDRIVEPPRIGAMVAGPVARCAPSDRVGAAARVMLEHSFSQLPVYEGETLVNLLTANAISRWVASKLSDDLNLLEEEPVAAVVEFREPTEAWDVVSREEPAAGLLERFAAHARDGRRLEAVIVTHSGKVSQAPLGIVNYADLPRLYEAVHV